MNEFIQIDNRRYFVFFAIVSFDDVAYFKDIGIRARLSKKKKKKNINDEIHGEKGEEFLKG